MKYVVLVLLTGCATAEPDTGAGPEEAESVAAVGSCPAWCQEPSPTTNRLHGVWTASASDVFAVGDNGAIVRRVNGTWTQMTSPTTNHLRGVSGTSSSDVWASGLADNGVGTVLHWNGTAWSLVSGATTDLGAACSVVRGGTPDLASVWPASASDVWFTGSSVVMRWNGSALSTVAGFSGP